MEQAKEIADMIKLQADILCWVRFMCFPVERGCIGFSISAPLLALARPGVTKGAAVGRRRVLGADAASDQGVQYFSRPSFGCLLQQVNGEFCRVTGTHGSYGGVRDSMLVRSRTAVLWRQMNHDPAYRRRGMEVLI
jgi:hypothetical protein